MLSILGVYSPKMKGANWLKFICHQGRSLVNNFSLCNNWYKSVVLLSQTMIPVWVSLFTHPTRASFSGLDLSCSPPPPVPPPLPIHMHPSTFNCHTQTHLSSHLQLHPQPHTWTPMTHCVDLDLTWHRMQPHGLLAVTVRLYHELEGHAWSAVSGGGKLWAKGVNFKDDESLLCMVPSEASLVDDAMVYVQAIRLDFCGETSGVNQGFSCQIPKQQDHFPRPSHHLARPFSHTKP